MNTWLTVIRPFCRRHPIIGGGVLRARDPLLSQVIHDRLLTAAALAEITIVADPQSSAPPFWP